jgi:hypothetical protein
MPGMKSRNFKGFSPCHPQSTKCNVRADSHYISISTYLVMSVTEIDAYD